MPFLFFIVYFSLVGPANLPVQDQTFNMTGNGIVSGWGDLESGGLPPDNLNWVEVPLVNDAGNFHK